MPDPKGNVFDIQRFSIHDGPGIRTTVFLKGCPLDCTWCHNPESKSPSHGVLLRRDRCIGCGLCLAACEASATHFGNGSYLEMAECSRDGACALACPAGALERVGRYAGPDEIMAEIRADSLFYEESGGGATFSGGEPLGQPDFLEAMLHRCRREEIATAVDTSGFAPAEVMERIAPLADLFLYDVKAFDSSLHRRITGRDNGVILGNLEALARWHPSIRVRFPLVPGFNDDLEDISRMARWLSRHGLRKVSVLPYHDTARGKHRLVSGVSPGGILPPGPDLIDTVADIFSATGLSVTTGGSSH